MINLRKKTKDTDEEIDNDNSIDSNDSKYNIGDVFKDNDESRHDDIADSIDSLDFYRKLDENNPLERASKFDMIKKNMPISGYMEVKCSDSGDIVHTTISESIKEDGTIKKIEHSPFLVVDLYSAINANIAQCPMNVVPMLIDQAQQMVELEKKTFKPEKRKDEFNWWWLIVIGIILMGIVPVTILMLMKFMGGG